MTQIACPLLLINSIFIYFHQFTDPYILAKWLGSVAIILLIGLYCSIKMIIGKSYRINMPFVGMCIIAVCSIEALDGLFQYFGILSSNSVHNITGSFDNPAGFAANLCIGLPFILFLSLNKKNIFNIWVGY